MGADNPPLKEELKKELMQELTADTEPPTEEAAEAEEFEEVEEEPQHPTWEEFLAFWDKSPAVFFEEGANKVIAEKLGVEPEMVKSSRLIPAIAYIPAYYLWPYVMTTSEESIPEPFRPLVRSIATLSGAVLTKKLQGGSNANPSFPAP